MKNIIIILNVILIAAVAFLFYKMNSLSDLIKQNQHAAAAPVSGSGIVYINSDSLLDQYPYFSALKNSLEHKQDSIATIVKNRGKGLENEIKGYQERAAAMTDQQRQSEEERLGKKQQEFLQYKDEMTNQLAREEENLNDSLHTDLINELKKYNKDKNYHFILGYQKGGGILLANDSLDVTKDIIKELNKEKK